MRKEGGSFFGGTLKKIAARYCVYGSCTHGGGKMELWWWREFNLSLPAQNFRGGTTT